MPLILLVNQLASLTVTTTKLLGDKAQLARCVETGFRVCILPNLHVCLDYSGVATEYRPPVNINVLIKVVKTSTGI